MITINRIMIKSDVFVFFVNVCYLYCLSTDNSMKYDQGGIFVFLLLLVIYITYQPIIRLKWTIKIIRFGLF